MWTSHNGNMGKTGFRVLSKLFSLSLGPWFSLYVFFYNKTSVIQNPSGSFRILKDYFNHSLKHVASSHLP